METPASANVNPRSHLRQVALALDAGHDVTRSGVERNESLETAPLASLRTRTVSSEPS